MNYPIFNQQGEKIDEAELSDKIFAVPFNNDLVHQVLTIERANQRQASAHVKTRAEVSGGGRKPWRQKGTGRARHGSIRSPIWKGGGVTFGPRNERVLERDLPKKMKKKALLMLLSEKAKRHLLVILDKLELDAAKTKIMAGVIKNLREKIKGFELGSLLIAAPEKDDKIFKAGRNIKNVVVLEARNVSGLDLASSKFLLITKQGLEEISKRF